MASYSSKLAVHETLAAGVADTVQITGGFNELEVFNHDAAALIYFRVDGTAAVAAANDTYVVAPGQGLVVPASVTYAGTLQASLISAGTPAYSVTGLA